MKRAPSVQASVEGLAGAIIRLALEDRHAAEDDAWADGVCAETGYPLEEFRTRWPGLGRRDLVRCELDEFFASEWFGDLLLLLGEAAALGRMKHPAVLPPDRRRGKHRRAPQPARQAYLPGLEPAVKKKTR